MAENKKSYELESGSAQILLMQPLQVLDRERDAKAGTPLGRRKERLPGKSTPAAQPSRELVLKLIDWLEKL